MNARSHRPLAFIVTTIVVLLLHIGATRAAESPMPNFVIIFADDLGYGDLGCYGHPSIRTPNLDRMAAEGTRFTDFYSTGEVCTPSRAALLTGRYPIRSGVCGDKRRVFFGNSSGGLPEEEVTLAEALKKRGYATACIGKWHLGIKPQFLPTRHGFDYFFGLPHSNDMDPTTNRPNAAGGRLDQRADWWSAPLYRNEEIIEQPTDQATLTRRYTEEAVGFITQDEGNAFFKNRGKPFFLYLAHTFPHVPLFASKEFRGKSPRGLYGDVVEEIDWSTGQVLDALRKAGLHTNTLVVFTSDNGPWLIQKLAGGSAGLLKDGKGSTWEGGMRVPCIAWWPGRVPAGKLQHGLACNMDFFPTFLKLAGSKIPDDREIDGIDMAPLLFGDGPGQRESFFYYRGTKLFAMRQGPWKMHLLTKPAYGRDPVEMQHDPPLLFHLDQDPSEQFNVASTNVSVWRDLKKEVDRHRSKLKPAKSIVDED